MTIAARRFASRAGLLVGGALALPLPLPLPLAAQNGRQSAGATAWDVTQTRGHTRTIDFTTTEGTFEAVDISARWPVGPVRSLGTDLPRAGRGR